MSVKTNNHAPIISELPRKALAIAAIGAVLVPAAIYGTSSKKKSEHESEPVPAQSSKSVLNELKNLPKEHKNILSVKSDPEHPGLVKISYRFIPGHNTISDVYSDIAPDQEIDHAATNVESYNGGSEITHNGQILTVEAETEHGFIVPKPVD